MINKVRNFLIKYDLYAKSAIVGFSTGPDSCALTSLLIKLKDEFKLNLILVYFNHGWREEAIEEEKFTQNFAKKHSLDFIVGKAPLDCKKTEETGRDLRYNFFEEIAREYCCDTVFLAHNKNDNIETLVYRIIKGTSVKGLCSIPEKRDIFYRPLLKVEKKEILNYLYENNIEYKIDKTNEDTKYKRNFIRHEILPLFEKLNPNYINNIDNLIETSNFVSNIVEKYKTSIEDVIIKDKVICRNCYCNLDKEYRLEILNSYLGDRLKYRDFKTINKLDDFIMKNPHSRTSLNKNEFLRTRKDKIYVEIREGEKDE